MKFQPDDVSDSNNIHRHDAQGIWVNGQLYNHSLIVPRQGEVLRWRPTRFEDLQPADFEALLVGDPELVVFGSGNRLRFAHPDQWRALVQARVGLETMDLAAACRTYNVLASERRRVVAALLIETA
jgi:uncharacterized protein